MKLTTSEKIRILLKRQNMSVTELATSVGTTRQNLTNKLSRDNFSENDLEIIARALKCKYKSSFIFIETGEEL